MLGKANLLPFLIVICAACLRAQAGTDYCVVVLDGAPVADRAANRAALRRPAALDHLRQVKSTQDRTRAVLESRGWRVTGSAQTLLNALFVRCSADDVSALKQIPGVRQVSVAPPLRHTLDRAVSLVGVPDAWNTFGGPDNAGAGIRIAVIDSGIEDTHPAFHDDSLPPLSPPEDLPADNLQYLTSKIVAGRTYVSMLPNPDEPSLRDHWGLGTAMAMIAAGAKNSGPAATITGVAPKAYIGNYKIFGTPGVNNSTYAPLLISALEDALRDGMDIALVSLGSLALFPPLVRDASCAAQPGTTFGLDVPADSCDVLAQALDRAARMNLTVVTSAGNSGYTGAVTPTLNTIESPGTAPSAITVGASNNAYSTAVFSGDGVTPDFEHSQALFGDGPRPSDPVTAPLRDVASLGDDGLACAPLGSGSLSGAIALIQRGGDCYFSDKVFNAQNAGAIGVIVIERSDLGDWIFNPLGLADTSIPTVMIGYTAGSALKDALQNSGSVTATLDPTAFDLDTQSVEGFSSRGPSIGDDAPVADQVQPSIKPELVAPGADLYTATQTLDTNGDLYDPSGYTYVEGTSASAALVAGAAALVKQQHPDFDPPKIKSAIVNTAVDIADGGSTARVTAMGAGRLNVPAAIDATTTLQPTTLSFGIINTLPISLALNVTNAGPDAATYQISVEQRTEDANAQVVVASDSLQLNPGETSAVSVSLNGSVPSPGSYEGFVGIQVNGASYRVPFMYLVGDGVPYNIFPVQNATFDYPTNTVMRVIFRVIDQYGVAVEGVPVTFRVTKGDGKIDCDNPQLGCADATTDRLGRAGAFVRLGPAGDQEVTAEAGGLSVQFTGTAEP